MKQTSLSWSNTFMDVARVFAQRSKDESTKVGSVITDESSRIVSTGYNGMVAGCDENYMSWDRPMKYALVLHAEMNALLFAKRDLKNCVLYSTQAPCPNCLKHALQSGIRTIIYDSASIMQRASDLEKEAVVLLIRSTGAGVFNLNTKQCLVEELDG